MNHSEISRRNREVSDIWRARMAKDRNDRACYDCATNYIFQYEECTLDSIQRGFHPHDDGYDMLPICEHHHLQRVAREAAPAERNPRTLEPYEP